MAGWSELIFGSMYCGKSEELIRRLKRAKFAQQNYQLFKPSIDNRYGETIVATHESNKTKKEIEKIFDIYVVENINKKELVKEVSKRLEGAMEAIVVKDSSEILKNLNSQTEVVGIDEIQFFDTNLISVIEELKKKNIRVICAGLDMYASGEPFGEVISYLACTSKYVDKLHAVCIDCGDNAMYSYKTSDSESNKESKVDVGSVGKYIALCQNCVEKRNKSYFYYNTIL